MLAVILLASKGDHWVFLEVNGSLAPNPFGVGSGKGEEDPEGISGPAEM